MTYLSTIIDCFTTNKGFNHMKKVLYEDDRGKIVQVGDLDCESAVITFFTYASVEESLRNVDGFGEAFFANKNYPALHFINYQNHWWSFDHVDNFLEIGKTALERTAQKIGYGSSMGAYAALRFSKDLNFDKVLGFSPQFSINPTLVPFEHRWQRQQQQFGAVSVPCTISEQTECHLVIGNDLSDLRHLKLILDTNPDVRISAHCISAGGHLSLKSYQDAQILRELLSELPAIDTDIIARHPHFFGSASTPASIDELIVAAMEACKKEVEG